MRGRRKGWKDGVMKRVLVCGRRVSEGVRATERKGERRSR